MLAQTAPQYLADRSDANFQLLYDDVCGCVRRFTHNGPDYEDTAHNVLLALWKRLSINMVPKKPDGWLVKTIYLQILKAHYDREKHGLDGDDHGEPLAPLWTDEEDDEFLTSLLAGLDADEREIIQRHFAVPTGRRPETLETIGSSVGLSLQRIQKIETSAITKLRQRGEACLASAG